jgi:deoxyadenosine/deoxycytidine kinase
MRRLQVRSRSEEKTVSLDYLHTLHGRHEAWLMKGAHSDPVALQVNKVPKLVIDANAEFERDPLRSEAMKKQVRDFLNSL